MENVYIIITSQEYEGANHKFLWREIASKVSGKVIIFNISADYLVSVLRGRTDRIKEALHNPISNNDGLNILRPLFGVRPEIVPPCMLKYVASGFWKNVRKVDPDIANKRVHILTYNARWIKALYGSHKNLRLGYYIYDEVRYNGHDNSLDKKAYVLDEYACKHSDVIFTMTNVIAQSRKSYNKNILNIGNGSCIPNGEFNPPRKFQKSIAFIGNFRNWIDNDLLESLVQNRQDILFVIVGSIESDMLSFFNKLINSYSNTIYYGRAKKEDMPYIYKMFDGVIVPYKDNQFIRATRPIKIVESIMAGTPVVTIPMDGYEENEFIRFASTRDEFSNQIDYILDNPIDKDNSAYKAFVNANTWSEIANVIIESL